MSDKVKHVVLWVMVVLWFSVCLSYAGYGWHARVQIKRRRAEEAQYDKDAQRLQSLVKQTANKMTEELFREAKAKGYDGNQLMNRLDQILGIPQKNTLQKAK